MSQCFGATLGAVILMFGASCGGGGAAAPVPNSGGPAAGMADIVGQLQQGAGGKATSAVGDSLASVLVQLINTATGDLVGIDTTDLQGRYEFKGVPAGQQYLLKVEFAPNATLTAAGAGATVELTLPLNPANQQTLSLLQQLGVVDSDGDGQLDAIRFENEIEDNLGVHRHRGSEHRFGDSQTVVDDNGNGDFSDDTPFDDSNHDGIGDDNGTGGHGHDGLLESAVRGVIEAISADSITVAGKTFGFTDATRFRDSGVTAPRESFIVGVPVEVEGLIAADGTVTALKIQLENESGDDNGGAVGGGGADDGAGHDVGDDNGGSGGGTDDGAGDDNGGGTDDGSGHDAGDDNGGDA